MNTLTAVTVSLTLFAAAQAQAGAPVYQFEQQGTGVVLAELELNQVPTSSLGDVIDFRFTAAGDSIFALGTGPLGGLFDFFGGSANDDGSNGLQGFGYLSMDSPPTPSDLTNYPGFTSSNTFRTGFGTSGNADTLDYRYDTNDGGEGLLINGDWVLVPEPTSLALLGLGGLLVARRRR